MADFITQYIRTARQKTLDGVPDAGAFTNIYFSGTTYALWRAGKKPTVDYSRGLVLDAGSGRGGWKSVINRGAVRESLDIAPKADERVTWVGDLTDMPQVPSSRYDAVINHQVIEHVAYPAAAIAEMFRVLKPGGSLVISVPHLSRQHELPHDYYRFTPNGLDRLLRDAGFKVVSISHFGGIFCFLHHQFATALLGIAAAFRPLHAVIAVLNSPFSVLAAALDRGLDRSGLFAVGVIAVATKPDRHEDG